MTDDKMPPLPVLLQRADQMYGTENLGNAVRAYASAYAAEQVRELVEGLQSAVDAWSGDGPPVVLDTLRALIAKHKGTP
jgi:hypothetical protein